MPVVADPKAVETLNNIKSQLRDAAASGGSSNATLYSHLTEVFNRCVQKHPTDSFDKFEEMSVLIKKTHMPFSNPKTDFEVNATKPPVKNSEIFLEHTKWRKDLLNGVSKHVFHNQFK